jgi:hypothetical protein
MAIDESLLRRLQAAPEEEIVAQLRRIYARRNERRSGRPAAPRVAPDPRADDLQAGDHHGADDSESPYERARRHFAGEERRLRRQAVVTERVIDDMRDRERARDGTPRRTQETLALRAAAGRPAAGRFRLANRFARALDVRMEVSPLRDPDGAPMRCRVDVRPSRLTLGPGEDRIVRVTIDLAGDATPAAGTRLEGEIAARAGTTSVHRLWLEVETYGLDDGD